MVPRTGRPWMTIPCFAGSSSRKPRTSRSVSSGPRSRAPRPALPRPRRERASGRGAPRSTAGALALPFRRLVQDSPQEPQAEDPHEAEHAPHQDDGEGNAPFGQRVREREAQGHERESRPPEREDEGLELAHADVAPDEAVDAREEERRNLNEDDDGHLGGRRREHVLRDAKVEPEEVRELKASREDQQVEEELDPTRDERVPAQSLVHAESPTVEHITDLATRTGDDFPRTTTVGLLDRILRSGIIPLSRRFASENYQVAEKMCLTRGKYCAGTPGLQADKEAQVLAEDGPRRSEAALSDRSMATEQIGNQGIYGS